MDVALGEIYTGVFSVRSCSISNSFQSPIDSELMQTSDELWKGLEAAGVAEHDRFWRMPLDDEYGPQIHSSNADLQNVSTALPYFFGDVDELDY